MNNMILYKISIRLSLGFVLMIGLTIYLSSCNDFLDESEVNNAAGETQQWNTFADVRSAFMGVYGLTRTALAENNSHWMFGELRYGDFASYKRADLKAVINNKLNSTHKQIQNVSNWRRFYAAINAVSIFIKNAPQVVEKDIKYSEVNLKYDIAQARALRAFLYFYMARVWGDVPLVTYSYDNGSFPEFAKSSSATVLNYAESELSAVIEDLPFLYGVSPSSYYGKNDDYWEGELFNKLSAATVLAHIAAWRGNYVDVDAYTRYILNNLEHVNASYTLVEDLTSSTGLFAEKSGSKLIGFSFGFENRETSESGHIEDLTLAYPLVQKSYPDVYVPMDTINIMFSETSDLRFGVDTTSMHFRSDYFYDINMPIPVFSKIKVVKDGQGDGDYGIFASSLIFSRPEEIALLRSEAMVVLNLPEEALSILNTLRSNRSLKVLRYSEDFNEDKLLLLKEIFNERRRELIGEGWRWYDQIRCQKIIGEDLELLELIQNGGIYWPVAQDVLNRNSLLIQNSYWQN
ncbi:MAG: RagB/SusD family nutrient uptake outer membrane protein [Bacteroidales bacterium]|nr:MAG: RagB/SusD family nutrient uptake outer membrane protein [Bacteroidales bacterium]